jgi:hypothetical protein
VGNRLLTAGKGKKRKKRFSHILWWKQNKNKKCRGKALFGGFFPLFLLIRKKNEKNCKIIIKI